MQVHRHYLEVACSGDTRGLLRRRSSARRCERPARSRQGARRGDGNGAEQLRRADLLLQRGATEKALQEYAAGFAAGEPGSPSWWLKYSRALLLVGDVPGHRRLCHSIWARFGVNRYVDEQFAALRACVLAPGVLEPAELVRVCRASRADVSGDPAVAHIGGLALLRAGVFDEAIRRLRESAQASPGSAWEEWPALALAYYGRGDAVEARIWLEKAENRLQEEGKAGGGVDAIRGENWFEFQILTREARTTLNGGKS
jgi:tetratricopeptide (TPR) repeat protein